MNGAQHFRQAEIENARADSHTEDGDHPLAADARASANVHANLAIAAALVGAYTAMHSSGGDAQATRDAWFGGTP